ncbi:hypothetical protein [Clostridium sp. AM58-1XD]|uniref:hypothetical protein n=1 Tax=Clostridium sp. AM58-1XD TaxID=2292307 RepID=UPI000E4B478C|nr:hypothetical protein [Clostridium sp. AM58-1XD]RGY96009.1 hypothetical protein DXA13_18080 [Clostridium sp. AM58-1XD]
MDVLFILSGVVCGIETIFLFLGKDYIMFRGGKQKEEDFDTEKLYHAEKWLFAVDAVLFLIIGASGNNVNLSLICIAAALVTLGLHLRNFRNPKYKKKKSSDISDKSRMKTK